MVEVEKPGELETFRETIEKIKANYVAPGTDFFKIKNQELGSLEMKNWEVYKKGVENFYAELNICNLRKEQTPKDAYNTIRAVLDEEDSLLRTMRQNFESIRSHMPAVYENKSKEYFYNWLKGRFDIMIEYLNAILDGPTSYLSFQNMKDATKKNVEFFKAVS